MCYSKRFGRRALDPHREPLLLVVIVALALGWGLDRAALLRRALTAEGRVGGADKRMLEWRAEHDASLAALNVERQRRAEAAAALADCREGRGAP